MQFRIGERVCEISGINADIDAMLAAEKLEEERKQQEEMDALAIDGDKVSELDESVNIGDLEQHANDYNANQV